MAEHRYGPAALIAMTEGRQAIPDDPCDAELAELTWMGLKRPVQINGPCPYASCLATEWHVHVVCPTCGAVRFGALNCADCLHYGRFTR